VDSEGVKSQAVNVVEKRYVDEYLVGRTHPDFLTSNGHGRAAPFFPRAEPRVLLLKVPKRIARRLKQKNSKVKDQDKPYVIA